MVKVKVDVAAILSEPVLSVYREDLKNAFTVGIEPVTSWLLGGHHILYATATSGFGVTVQFVKTPNAKPIPRQCPICVVKGNTTVYLRVTDHVRWVQALTADPMKPLMSEARAKTGPKVKKTKPRNYYSCWLCDRSVIDRLRHLEQEHKMEAGTFNFVYKRRPFPESRENFRKGDQQTRHS
ncbi:uncharacterized protein LOC127871264 isoform X1 [Dreissena polymorpha]|nr:uncharacterized protein LOC127871264 isoform X1 [Dreissena polymorpha]XP_052269977.1 uncharacterized protein LOC127871264 isoform X1 [Dreissena polymorpha]XP_052269978.1 uncharacterized protein LOC127871264 isoform X1 [Dreissena polymorpha]XP_052269979.1 uncharacterized protein LOC127871264 isoform X1 [Dreissena polymorpha]